VSRSVFRNRHRHRNRDRFFDFDGDPEDLLLNKIREDSRVGFSVPRVAIADEAVSIGSK
jgi:hypothetical protein